MIKSMKCHKLRMLDMPRWVIKRYTRSRKFSRDITFVRDSKVYKTSQTLHIKTNKKLFDWLFDYVFFISTYNKLNNQIEMYEISDM